LRTKWKEFHKKLLLAPKFDVKCDKPTTEGRERAKQALKNGFTRSNSSINNDEETFDSNSDKHQTVINDLEFSIFEHCDKLVNPKYYNKVRVCIKLISNNGDLRSKILRHELTSDEFVEAHLSGDVFRDFKTDFFSKPSTENLEELEEIFL
jgi:hypothetical protein